MTKFDFKQWIIDNKAQNKRALNENYYEGDIDEIENKGWKNFKKKLNPKNWFEEQWVNYRKGLHNEGDIDEIGKGFKKAIKSLTKEEFMEIAEVATSMDENGEMNEVGKLLKKLRNKWLNKKPWFEEIDEDDMMDEQSDVSDYSGVLSNPNSIPVEQETVCGTITGNVCHSFSKCLGANTYGISFVRANGGGSVNPSNFYNAVGSPNQGSHFKDNTGQKWRYDGIDPQATITVVFPAVTSATNCCNCTCVYGCTDSNANNYNPNASCNDGSCTYGTLEFSECQNCCCRERGGAAFEEGVNPTINAVYQLMEQAARQRTGKIPTDLEPTPTNPVGRAKPTTKPDVKFAAPTSLDPYGPIGPEEPIGGCIDGTQYDPDVSTIIPDTGMCKCPNPGTVGILSYSNPNPGTPNTTGASNGTGPCV
tara:strand:+ start:110 stop:1372 length:1263 start_codon:yes stop_codon:yes gene_type:complete